MRTRSPAVLAGVVVLWSVLPIHGQDLPALVAKLKALRGKDAIRAAVLAEADRTVSESSELAESAKLRLSVASDANGLSLTALGEVADTRLSREFSLFRASEIVHYGPSLARELAGMELVESRPDSRGEVPCIRWRLQAEEKRSQSGAAATVHKETVIWIDADGYPLAASFKKRAEGRMLFFRMTRESAGEQDYKRCGDHLVLVRDRTEEADGDGKSKGVKRIVTTSTEIMTAPGSRLSSRI
jgi:hypothetical protein